jgi:hypothetical protein
MKRAYKNRLIKLAEILENFEEEKKNLVEPITSFNMASWKCGTAACAAGIASLHPWFRRRGLKLGLFYNTSLSPGYKNNTGYFALSRFFGLSIGRPGDPRTDETAVFDPCHYGKRKPTPKIVAKALRKLAETR